MQSTKDLPNFLWTEIEQTNENVKTFLKENALPSKIQCGLCKQTFSTASFESDYRLHIKESHSDYATRQTKITNPSEKVGTDIEPAPE